MKGSKPEEINDKYCYINPRYNVTLGYITSKLYEFKDSMNSIYVPNTGNDFIKNYIQHISVMLMSIKQLLQQQKT